jgi:hypothetical protein
MIGVQVRDEPVARGEPRQRPMPPLRLRPPGRPSSAGAQIRLLSTGDVTCARRVGRIVVGTEMVITIM